MGNNAPKDNAIDKHRRPDGKIQQIRLAGYRTITTYVEPSLYEKVRCAAYYLGEDVYQFVNDALAAHLKKRMTPAQLKAASVLAAGQVKNSRGKDIRGTRNGKQF